MRGRGNGPGKQRRRRGQGKRKRITGFLQPCILLQLSHEDRHGYDLQAGMTNFLEDGGNFDPSILYRLLRDMEEEGYLSSYEGDRSYGPPRRMYTLTTEGDRFLQAWIADLRRTREEIDNLLQKYEQGLSPGATEQTNEEET